MTNTSKGNFQSFVVSEEDFETIGPVGDDLGKAAVVWVRDERDRVLFQIRDNFDHIKMGGRLGYFGGHVEDGENLIEAARRELEEETGLSVDYSELIPRIAFVSPTNDRMLHFVFELSRRIHPSDIVVYEGAGYVFLEPSQFDDFPVLPAARLAEQHLNAG